MDAFLGEVRAFPFTFAPYGWAYCFGQTMQISQYAALYSVIGTQYGGDGNTTFALPNLQGQAAIGYGQATTGTIYPIGQDGGETAVTLDTSQIPYHTHTVNGATATSPIVNTIAKPANNTYMANPVLKTTATTGSIGRGYAPYSATPIVNLNPQVISVVGGSQPHTNMMPYLTFAYCICLNGEYPPRPNN